MWVGIQDSLNESRQTLDFCEGCSSGLRVRFGLGVRERGGAAF